MHDIAVYAEGWYADGRYGVCGNTVKWETFEGENFREFRGSRAICKNFLHEILGMPHPLMLSFKQSVNVFFVKFSLPMDLRKFSPSKVYRYTVCALQAL